MFGLVLAALALCWVVAAVIVVLEQPLPPIPGESTLQLIRRFKRERPGLRTYIVVYGGLLMLVINASLWVCLRLLK